MNVVLAPSLTGNNISNCDFLRKQYHEEKNNVVTAIHSLFEKHSEEQVLFVIRMIDNLLVDFGSSVSEKEQKNFRRCIYRLIQEPDDIEFLSMQCAFNSIGKKFETPKEISNQIFVACMINDIPKVQGLLVEHQVNINCCYCEVDNKKEQSHLITRLCLEGCSDQTMKFLVRAGAQLKKSFIHVCAGGVYYPISKRIQAIKFLHKRGVVDSYLYVNTPDTLKTVIAGPKDIYPPAVLNCLIELGFDVNGIDSSGNSPLDYAMLSLKKSPLEQDQQRMDLARYLIYAGAKTEPIIKKLKNLSQLKLFWKKKIEDLQKENPDLLKKVAIPSSEEIFNQIQKASDVREQIFKELTAQMGIMTSLRPFSNILNLIRAYNDCPYEILNLCLQTAEHKEWMEKECKLMRAIFDKEASLKDVEYH